MPGREQRLELLGDELRAGGRVEQRLRARVDLERGVLDERADPLGQLDSARLAQHEHLPPALVQRAREGSHERRLAGAVEALDGDQAAPFHEGGTLRSARELGRARTAPPRRRRARRRRGWAPVARVPAARAGRERQAQRGARGRRRAARARSRGPGERAHARPARRAPGPDLGRAERRARDAAPRRRRGRRGGGRAHAVRGELPRLRARARRHDERRGGQRAAQDARGAGGLRRPAAADRPADAGAADDRVALPAGALRRAAAGGAGGAAAGARRRAGAGARRPRG